MIVRWSSLGIIMAALIVALSFHLAVGLTQELETLDSTSGKVHFWLTLLHNNDGESQLINAGSGLEDFGGVARFATLVRQLKQEAADQAWHGTARRPGSSRGVIMVTSGDNFLAGPEFNSSIEKGVPFYDSIALDLIGYDAMAIGNHEFDFGPDVLADFILGFTSAPTPFLSANLDVSQEPRLQALVERERIARSVVVVEAGERIGIVGATTPALPFISSPRNVPVDSNVAAVVQAEIDRLESQGVTKIILISHLQSIEEDLALAPLLRGVDIMVAGGGSELLANPGDLLLPGDEVAVFGAYPLFATDAAGNSIPVVTTSGDYRYVGRLVVGFDWRGKILALDDGTMIVQDGAVVPSASALHLATIDFLARGGDQYPFRGVPFVTLGVTYQQALRLYIEEGLAGIITAARYPAAGEGRITTVE